MSSSHSWQALPAKPTWKWEYITFVPFVCPFYALGGAKIETGLLVEPLTTLSIIYFSSELLYCCNPIMLSTSYKYCLRNKPKSEESKCYSHLDGATEAKRWFVQGHTGNMWQGEKLEPNFWVQHSAVTTGPFVLSVLVISIFSGLSPKPFCVYVPVLWLCMQYVTAF